MSTVIPPSPQARLDIQQFLQDYDMLDEKTLEELRTIIIQENARVYGRAYAKGKSYYRRKNMKAKVLVEGSYREHPQAIKRPVLVANTNSPDNYILKKFISFIKAGWLID